MNIDSNRGIDALMTEAVILPQSAKAFASVEQGGFPESGGPNVSRQEGDQYILRIKKANYLTPKVHDAIITTNFGTVEVKQKHSEGDVWALRCTGKISGRKEL